MNQYIEVDGKLYHYITSINDIIEFKNGIYKIDDIELTHQPNMKMIIKTIIVEDKFELLITQEFEPLSIETDDLNYYC